MSNKNPSANKINPLFVLTVVVPTLIAIIYYGFLASDIYISESKFVLRGPEKKSESDVGSLLKGMSASSSDDDAFAVQNFILSRDALGKLQDSLGIREAFSRTDVNIFDRFAGFSWLENSFEDLYKYYQEKIGLEIDDTSGVSTLQVHAFTKEDAYAINEKLLELSENLVNKLNERARQDLIVFATNEVDIAESKAEQATAALSSYRNLKNVINPEQQTTLHFELISKLQESLITARGQLFQMETFTKSNPQIPSIKARIQELEQEIQTETNRVAGGDKSLARKAAEYERLSLDRDFADKLLSSTLSSLEMARNEAARKQMYLERIVQPNLPDDPLEPRRFRAILSTFLLGMVAWGVLSVLVASIKEHQD